ncbi:hypothetical protein DFH08DRAFT_958663 [Mycena albidolilacea]|uniref:Uncharacterized protein n=1 Tax=Mycena albidolilacea TaxID=1033008 RepID=A0AAD7A510_9AGAR|nr:hypothetical protein DFH08DRAFT_958663 [Mycena albidolilacea]
MSGTQHRLVTVNTVPERAKRLIGRVVEDVKDRIEDVKETVEREKLDVPVSHRLPDSIADFLAAIHGFDVDPGAVKGVYSTHA